MKSITGLELDGVRVLLRCDFNVPITNGCIVNTAKVDASLETIRYLQQAGASVVMMSHLGRPKGPDSRFSLRPVHVYLEHVLECPVTLIEKYPGVNAVNTARELPKGGLALLENLRFHEEEKKNDAHFAQELSYFGEVFVNDAFAVSHRKQASLVAITNFLPAYSGLRLEKEIATLRKLHKPKRPFVIVIGGAKLSTKLGLLKDLALRADAILLGGAMIFTCYKALGFEVGNSLVEPGLTEDVKTLLHSKKIMLPVDLVVAKNPQDTHSHVVDPQHISADQMGLDIGPETAAMYSTIIKEAKTVFWNGPLGFIEEKPFREGTRVVAQAMAASKALTIAGGGDTLEALDILDVNGLSYCSTGGGASLDYIQCAELPGLVVLE